MVVIEGVEVVETDGLGVGEVADRVVGLVRK